MCFDMKHSNKKIEKSWQMNVRMCGKWKSSRSISSHCRRHRRRRRHRCRFQLKDLISLIQRIFQRGTTYTKIK